MSMLHLLQGQDDFVRLANAWSRTVEQRLRTNAGAELADVGRFIRATDDAIDLLPTVARDHARVMQHAAIADADAGQRLAALGDLQVAFGGRAVRMASEQGLASFTFTSGSSTELATHLRAAGGFVHPG